MLVGFLHLMLLLLFVQLSLLLGQRFLARLVALQQRIGDATAEAGLQDVVDAELEIGIVQHVGRENQVLRMLLLMMGMLRLLVLMEVLLIVVRMLAEIRDGL